MGDEEGLEPPPTTIRNRYHLVVAVLPLHQSSLCLLYSANMIKVIHIGFSELSLLTRLQRFRQCLHRQFFVPVQFVFLLDADQLDFSYCVRPFARSRHPSMLSGYFFSTPLFKPMCQRTTSLFLSEPLPMQDCSCPDYLLYKVVDLPLHRSRYTRNGISKRV